MSSDSHDRPSDYQLIGLSEDGSVGDLLVGCDQKKSRIRLQALIAEWLRMEHLVVLTGSGTSVSSGGKTMANLETAVFEVLGAAHDIPDPIKAIISKRDEAFFDIDGPINFENWLSYIVNALFVSGAKGAPFDGVVWPDESNPSRNQLKWFVDKISRTIFAECALTLADPDSELALNNKIPHLSFLSKLIARDNNLGRTHLFTLNYDTLFEQALELLGIQYFDGFTGRADARFDPSVYGLDIYYPGEAAEGRVRRFDKFMQFYKLHGSIHWYEQAGEMRARHPDLLLLNEYHSLTPFDKSEFLKTLSATTQSVGILPTANKFAQTLAMPYAHLFRSFQIRLAVPQTFLLVLGYGFGDSHITQIIETALTNPSLVMLVVEPDPTGPITKKIQNYRDLGKRAFVLSATDAAFEAQNFKHATFDDFAQRIMPDVQWLDEFLRLRRFEKQISATDRQGLGPDGDY